MQVRYGHKWLSLIEDEEIEAMTVADWQEQLAGLSGDDVSKGLNSLPKTWPPSVDEFKYLCLGSSSDDIHHTMAYIPFSKQVDKAALPQKADKAKASKAVSMHRHLLSGQMDARERQRHVDDAHRLLFGGDSNG